jgi:SAM-dependent methyltransferase
MTDASVARDVVNQLTGLLRCPLCRSPLHRRPAAFHCRGDASHFFACDRPYVVFAPEIDQGKYDEEYATRYAFLWAYAYETRHSGLVESLYRSVGALAAEALARLGKQTPVILDCGCGTGRGIADASVLAPSALLIGVDASFAKLDLATRILTSSAPVQGTLSDYGFDTPLTIRGRALANVLLFQADARRLPLDDGSADLMLCVNLLDRVEGGPQSALQEARRVLRPGGALVLTTPMNWPFAHIWNAYPDAGALLRGIGGCGFDVVSWFDHLSYREILDRRGSFEEFSTLVCSAVAV